MKIALDSVTQDFSDKKIILKESDALFAKALAAKIFKDLKCEVHLAHSVQDVERGLVSDGDYFAAIIDCVDGSEDDFASLDLSLKSAISTVAVIKETDNDTLALISSKNIADCVLRRDIDDIDSLVRIIRRLALNSNIEILLLGGSLGENSEISKLLTVNKFKLHYCENQNEALSLLRQNQNIEVVAIDLNSIDGGGFDTLDSIRSVKSRDMLHILSIGANDDAFLPLKALKYGADDSIGEGFLKEDFLSKINMGIERLMLVKLQKEYANFDFLTSLYNRQYLMSTGEKLHANAVRGNINFIVGIIDIDNFKTINQLYGHDAGDSVLKNLARRLESTFRGSDIVCRYAGESFCVILTNVEDGYIEYTFEKLLNVIREGRVATKDGSISYSVSVGVCATMLTSFADMVKKSIQMAERAKELGRNRVVSDLAIS